MQRKQIFDAVVSALQYMHPCHGQALKDAFGREPVTQIEFNNPWAMQVRALSRALTESSAEAYYLLHHSGYLDDVYYSDGRSARVDWVPESDPFEKEATA